MAEFMLAETGVGTILIAGPPACGKSTQCGKLLEKYGLLHVSAGDILRTRRKYLPELAEYMDQGLLVPDDLVCAIIKERLVQKDCQDKGVLLDGFPRTRRQAEVLAQLGIDISHMILLEVPDEVVMGRVEGRRIDPVSGEIFNIKLKPPVDPEVTRRLITREDDTREKMTKRLSMYHDNIASILEFYGSIVRRVDADNHPEKVFDGIRDVIEGELYWGCVISREWSVRAYECSSVFDFGSNDVITAQRYFDHLTWLMLGRGVLADVRHPISFSTSTPTFEESPASFVVRAHAVEVLQNLLPGLRLHLSLWLESVGTRSVTLCSEIYTTPAHVEKTLRLLAITGQRKQYLETAQAMVSASGARSARIIVARGQSTLVSLHRDTGKVINIPQRRRLRNLVQQRGAKAVPSHIQSATRLKYDERRPRQASCVEIAVRSMDVGLDGFINPSTLVSYVESARSAASWAGRTVRAVWFENLAKAGVGHTLAIYSWQLASPPKGPALAPGSVKGAVFFAFEAMVGSRTVMRGCQLLAAPAAVASSL